jgi:GR25 family glycosyltransferase involved in LPS biosynthesis
MNPAEIRYHVINLDSRPDRMAWIKGELARAGITAKRVQATVRQKGLEPIPGLAASQGQIGCYLSHRRLLESWIGREEILGVLEDDAVFCDDYAERMEYIAKHLTWPWDLFWLGSCYHCNPAVWHRDDLGRDFEQTAVPHIHRLYGAFATHGYLVNPGSIPKILALMDRELHRCYAIDHLLILIGPELNWYGFTPGMVFQEDGPSDVDSGVRRFSDFCRICGPYVFARRLEDFDYFAFDWNEGKL